MSDFQEPIHVVLLALYRYQNFPVRILHALLENIEGVRPFTIFFKDFYTNAVKHPTLKEEQLLKEIIAELAPKLVGLSVYSPYLYVAKRVTNIIRSNSSASVIWGGIHPTLSPETCIKEADMVCIGEGEGAFTELVTALRDETDYRHIKNLWINTNGAVTRNPMRPLIQDVDRIPFPAYGRDSFYFIGSNKVIRKDPTIADPILALMPARGCPFTCSYCVNSLLRPMYKGLGRFSRRRSVDNIIAEMQEILAISGNKKRVVEFHDENFGTDETWLNEFEAHYPSEIGLPFKVQYNPKLIKPSMIERLVKSGLHRVKFGIEAGTDHVRNQVFGRPGKNTEILQLAQEIAKYEVKVRYDLILDNPYDSEESLNETIRLLLQLPQPRRFNLYSLQYFPDYPLTLKALADGHIDVDEAGVDSLEKRMARNWAFVPKLLPFSKKQMLQNIIWLIAYGHADDKVIEDAVFNCNLKSKVQLLILHFQAYFLGKLQHIRRLLPKKQRKSLFRS
jgi:anaerobic magnesium-protoporphyrin IX monomethyl ester cyclase